MLQGKKPNVIEGNLEKHTCISQVIKMTDQQICEPQVFTTKND